MFLTHVNPPCIESDIPALQKMKERQEKEKISGEITLISRCYRKQYMLYIIKHTHLYTMMVNLCRFSPVMLVMVKKGNKMLAAAAVVTGGRAAVKKVKKK